MAVSFVLGTLITVAEPDLQVLANQVSSVMNGKLLIYVVGFGVVALVAMAPLITVQLLGFKAIVTTKIKERRAMKRILAADDEQIINFI